MWSEYYHHCIKLYNLTSCWFTQSFLKGWATSFVTQQSLWESITSKICCLSPLDCPSILKPRSYSKCVLSCPQLRIIVCLFSFLIYFGPSSCLFPTSKCLYQTDLIRKLCCSYEKKGKGPQLWACKHLTKHGVFQNGQKQNLKSRHTEVT